MKTLFIVLAAAFAAGAMAQQVATATHIPAGTVLHHGNAVVGPDGIGHVVNGPNAQAMADSVTLWENDQDFGSNSYGNQGTTDSWEMELPFLGENCIDWMTFVYCANGASTDTVQLNVTFYDDAAGPANTQCIFYEWQGCTGLGAINTSVAFTGLAGSGCWIYTLTFSPSVTIIGSSEYGWTFVGSSAGVVTGGVGPFIANGFETGITFGYPMQWAFGTTPVSTSAARKPHSWTINGAGCYWFGGCGLQGNFMNSFHGHQPWEFKLAGDYGINGPAFARPRDVAYMTVTNSGGTAQTNLVKLYTNPDTNACWGGLPFFIADTYSIQFLNQNGYLSATAAGQVPVVDMLSANCAPAQYTYLLVAGDVGGDNAINLKDLSTVLKNFSKVGN